MIEPGSQRERVRREANRLIAQIRDRAMRIVREHRGLCPDHGHALIPIATNVYGCPRTACTHRKQLLSGPPSGVRRRT